MFKCCTSVLFLSTFFISVQVSFAKLPSPQEYVPKYLFDKAATKYCFPDTYSSANQKKCKKFNKAAPVYWEGVHCSSKTYKLTYWLWYGWQKECGFGKGSHDNDWERVTLNFTVNDKQEYKLHSVRYHQHNGYYTRAQTNKTTNVWIGKKSHGSYHYGCKSPQCLGGCGYWDDFRNNKGGIQWKPTNLKKLTTEISSSNKKRDYCGIGDCTNDISDPISKVTNKPCSKNNASFNAIKSTSKTAYDKPFLFECNSGSLASSKSNSKAIYYIKSTHNNKKEDRVWEFKCRSLGSAKSRCNWTSKHINSYDKTMKYEAKSGYFISGFESVHSNKKEDRIWHVKTCKQDNKTLSSCSWTKYQNEMDKQFTLTLKSNEVIAGIESYHSNKKEDRRWKYKVCTLK